MTDPDRKLKDLLGPPARGVDRFFVNHVVQQVLVEQHVRRNRLRAWTHFGRDLLASGGVIGMLVAFARGGSGTLESLQPIITPATLAIFIFGIWAAAALRPAALQAS